jgi:hypothetical protein
MAGRWATTPHFETATRHFVEQIPKIQNALLYLERKGRAENTITGTRKALIELAKRANLEKTEDVELAIARYIKQDGENASLTWKAHLCTAYNHYCKFYKINWEMPTYTPDEKSIQPPSAEKCAMLLAGARGTLSMKIDISTQTGLRPIEIQGEKGLRVKDIHSDQKTITAINTKGCNARPPIPISIELVTKLQTYIIKNNLKPNDLLFKGKARNYGDHFRRFKKRLAKQLADPTIEAIRLYDLRHAYITNKLRKIQNAEIVRQLVGHKRLNTTQKYFHLLAQNGEWIVEGTTDKERAKELLANDLTYQLTTPDGTMLFKKPK